MPYIGNDLATQFQAFATQTITGDGSTGYTLDRAVANGKELLVYINNVKQEEGSGKAYTASGTTITFSEAVASGDSCYLVYMGSAQQTVVPPDNSVTSAMLAKDTSGNLTLDIAGDITLDADGGDITLKDGGSTFGTLTNNSGTFLVNANTNITTRAGVHTFDNTDGSSEYMRIDSSGNLFVGKTSSGSANVGFEYNNAGQLAVTRSGDAVALLNRTSSDGNILDIRKDNTLVGSIGSVSGTDIELNSTLSGSLSAGGTKRFGWNTSGVFFPHTDNANDLGASGSRFKDLYLSGGLLVGGTGSANKLDDYEEGTWSPTHASGAGSGSFSNALYTKVGRLVHIALSFAFTGASGGLVIGNLPFTANNHSAGIGREDVTNGFTVHTMVTVNTTQINVRGSFATGNPSAYAVSAGTFRISLTYTTDS